MDKKKLKNKNSEKTIESKNMIKKKKYSYKIKKSYS